MSTVNVTYKSQVAVAETLTDASLASNGSNKGIPPATMMASQ
jgi:hypothetical protein